MKNLYILLFIIIFFVSIDEIKSREKAVIFNDYTTSDTVDFGMCFLGDTLRTSFTVLNLTDTALFIRSSEFSFQKGTPAPLFSQHFQFIDPKLPDVYLFNQPKKLIINYAANLDTTSPDPDYRPKKNIAFIKIGLYDTNKTFLPLSYNDVEYYKQFTLIARKTNFFVDTYEKVFNYDSVWVNPKDSIYYDLIIQNSWKTDLMVDSIKLFRSNNAEIRTLLGDTTFIMPRYQSDGFQRHWRISYYPVDISLDTASFRIFYNPVPDKKRDSVVQRATNIYGVGVRYDLRLKDTISGLFLEKTINFGDILVGEEKNVTLEVTSWGNINMGIRDQRILKNDIDLDADGFIIMKNLNSLRDFVPFTTDTISIKFKPERSDTFNARFVVFTDIDYRKIKGVTDSARKVVLHLTGVGKQAILANMPDTIDLGNIVMREGIDCPARRDSQFVLSNIGNLGLEINNIKIEPNDNNNPFKVDLSNITIPGKESRQLPIKFDPIIKQIGRYEAVLKMTSNSPKPNDTISIKLLARGVYPDTTDLGYVQEYKAKPGRRISIPLIIEKNKITRAKEYTDTLRYNKSLLKFYRGVQEGTASEQAPIFNFTENRELGELYINVSTLGNEYFLRRDTLVILEFDTFLGNNISSNLHFVNSTLGDRICSRILSVNAIDGIFSLDSVCGLDMKIGNFNSNKFVLYSPNPNPAFDKADIQFEMAFRTGANINLYNSYGDVVIPVVNEELTKGEYSKTISLSDLSPGIYFLEMKAGIFRDVRTLILAK